MAIKRIGVSGLRANTIGAGGASIVGGDEGYLLGGYKVVIFNKSQRFRIYGSPTVEYLLAGGGGAPGGPIPTRGAGGGGAGGYLSSNAVMNNVEGSITIGAGAKFTGYVTGSNGGDTVVSGLTKVFGGGGGGTISANGVSGGSGGGAGNGAATYSGGSPTVTGQGSAGGGANGSGSGTGAGGGGGGAGGAGGQGPAAATYGGVGGAAVTSTILGYSDTFCKGGDGGHGSADLSSTNTPTTPLKPNRGHGPNARGGGYFEHVPASDGVVIFRFLL